MMQLLWSTINRGTGTFSIDETHLGKIALIRTEFPLLVKKRVSGQNSRGSRF